MKIMSFSAFFWISILHCPGGKAIHAQGVEELLLPRTICICELQQKTEFTVFRQQLIEVAGAVARARNDCEKIDFPRRVLDTNGTVARQMNLVAFRTDFQVAVNHAVISYSFPKIGVLDIPYDLPAAGEESRRLGRSDPKERSLIGLHGHKLTLQSTGPALAFYPCVASKNRQGESEQCGEVFGKPSLDRPAKPLPKFHWWVPLACFLLSPGALGLGAWIGIKAWPERPIAGSTMGVVMIVLSIVLIFLPFWLL